MAVIGGAEGELRVVNLAKGRRAGGLVTKKAKASKQSRLWTSAVGGAASIVATGATDGKICIWDLTKMKLWATLSHNDSITSIHASPSASGLEHHSTSSSSDGHRGPVLAAAVGAYQEYVYVLTAGDDGVCLVFDAKL
ncbi:hypothetical protein FRB90_004897 [Tulasnella sp. 427]|nr:hypothetical protein FRB90_004897 [Tulasnella sp. 427]